MLAEVFKFTLKMLARNTILIISESLDISTYKVVDYLHYLSSVCVKVITPKDIVLINSIRISNSRSNIVLKHNNDAINFEDVRSIWYRRGYISGRPADTEIAPELNVQINHFLATEWDKVTTYLLSIRQLEPDIFLLGSLELERHCNKLINLRIASSVGLTIPETIISSESSSLMKFAANYENLATKPISNTPTFLFGDKTYSSGGTKILTKAEIHDLPQNFHPLLAQEYIDKSYEIRVFFLKGELYSMAIFSQENEKTKTDYRNYDISNPNRVIPVDLPSDIKQKITEFMRILCLNLGSIDLIYSRDGRYFFLEVNPSGQFDWLSYNCNYNIEKKIAKILLNEACKTHLTTKASTDYYSETTGSKT